MLELRDAETSDQFAGKEEWYFINGNRRSLAVWLKRSVIEAIRTEAVSAYHSIRIGGNETGGVLFGRVQSDRIDIHSVIPLVCEHRFGPSFTLSPQDRQRLSELLKNGWMDERGQALIPLGWYCSHTRSALEPSPNDYAVHRSFFPKASDVLLIVSALSPENVCAGVFHGLGLPPLVASVVELPNGSSSNIVVSNGTIINQPTGFKRALKERSGGALREAASQSSLFRWAFLAPRTALVLGALILVAGVSLSIVAGLSENEAELLPDVPVAHALPAAPVPPPAASKPGTATEPTLPGSSARPPEPIQSDAEAALRQQIQKLKERNRRLEVTLQLLRDRQDP
jgi:proteasome lid subunit RPN8/RPN11